MQFIFLLKMNKYLWKNFNFVNYRNLHDQIFGRTYLMSMNIISLFFLIFFLLFFSFFLFFIFKSLFYASSTIQNLFILNG